MTMRKLIELVTTMDHTVDDSPPPPHSKPRDEGQGPREGLFWMRGDALVPIAGQANEIVFLSGQVVMLNPEKFGLTPAAIMRVLAPHGNAQHSPAQEYATFLQGTAYDLSRIALLWKSSRLIYEMMLTAGWAWVKYAPPEFIHF